MSTVVWRSVEGIDHYIISNEGEIIRNEYEDSLGRHFSAKSVRPYRQGPSPAQILIYFHVNQDKPIVRPLYKLIMEHFPEIPMQRCRELASAQYILRGRDQVAEPLHLDGEEWRDYERFKGFVQVSNLGRVKRCQRFGTRNDGKEYTVSEKILSTQHMNRSRNQYVALRLFNAAIPVYRLVAETFVPNPNGYKYVKFIDDDPDNLKADNLMWVEKRPTRRQMKCTDS